MPQTLHGKAHGRTIELDQDPGVPDGQEVEVTLRVVQTGAVSKLSGDGIRRSAGPLPDDSPADDRILAQVQRSRQAARLREVE
jgi:hypothetical protein